MGENDTGAGTLGVGQMSPDPPRATWALNRDAEALLILDTPAQEAPLPPLSQVPVLTTCATLPPCLRCHKDVLFSFDFACICFLRDGRRLLTLKN